MKRNTAKEIRDAATGRWIDILQSVGFSADVLDGQHHPCPKCGGTDRFRLIDREAGAVLCGQCFTTKNGDGLAAVQWLLGCEFREAVSRVAEYLGISTESSRGKKADPAADLDWRPWSSELVEHYLAAKPGVTEAAILAAGGRMARYKSKFTVIALPIIGETLDIEHPVGWIVVNAMGGDLPKWDKNGEVTGTVKTKVTYGSQPGLVGQVAIERMKVVGLVDVVWKTEGVSDLLAVTAAIPASQDRHVAVTNSNGARQQLGWMAGLLSRYRTHVLHDCDEPGQAGAASACADISQQGGRVCNVVLPYAIEKNHGKDVRDWLNDHHTYADLIALADQATIVETPRTESGEVDYSQAAYPAQENILRKLQIEVLYETDEGRIRVFSWLLRKSSWIAAGQIARMRKEQLVQICGPTALACISTDPDGESSWSIADVREAIALAASSRREKHDERGVGVWQGRDEAGSDTNVVLLANGTSIARWNGTGDLEQIASPRTDNLVFDFGKGHEWYDYDELARFLQNADDAVWRRNAIESAAEFFCKWRWKKPDRDPLLITGLVMATWLQTIWRWRPLIVVIGQSNSGKSLLFEALGNTDGRRGIFGELAFRPDKATEPGVRQGIGNTAKTVLCDEFEKSRDREKLLEMFRVSTRGGMIARGTAGDQEGKQFRLRHIGWMAAIESGLDRQPDINRFIQFELLTATKGKEGGLSLPDGDELHKMGLRLLAVSIRSAIAAKAMAVAIKNEKVEGLDPRVIESYSVPAAILAVSTGQDEAAARATLHWLLGREEAGDATLDHEELIESIISASINCGAKDGLLTVGQVIESQSLFYEHAARLEAAGVAVKEQDGAKQLIIAHKQVRAKLLKGTQWEGQRIDQILLRAEGAERSCVRIAGGRPRTITIPYQQ